MKDLRPSTAQEYVKMVDQAIIEVEEMIACLEYETESASADRGHLDPLMAQLRTLRATMADGSYAFGNEDLPFMPLVWRMGNLLPIGQLLETINQTHRYGLNVDPQ